MRSATNTAGLTLIELMIALSVSSLIVLAGIRLYAHAGSMLHTARAEQSLEETARFALVALREDIERAGFLGLIPPGSLDAEDFELLSAVTVRGDCGDRWSIRLAEPVGGSNNGYRWGCRAYAGSAAPNADTLILRYAEPAPADNLDAGLIYLRSSASGLAGLFVAPLGPARSDGPLVSTHRLHARGYYISTTSTGATSSQAVPSLRVKQLGRRNGQAVILDNEVQPNVEDLQIELETDSGQFFTTAEIADDAQVVAIRIWLLVRSTHRTGNIDGPIPAYADRPAQRFTDGYRRKLVTTTIAINDDRPM